MKRLILSALFLSLIVAGIAQPGEKRRLPQSNPPVNKTVNTTPVLSNTTDNNNNSNSKRTIPSAYSGIYSNSFNTNGITVTKTFNLGTGTTQRFDKVYAGNDNRGIEPTTAGKVGVPRKNSTRFEGTEKENCLEEDRKITLDDQGFLTLDISSQVTKIYPGKAFHFEDYNNGSWRDIQENRRPFRISCSEPNIIGNVTEEVNDPREGTIRQAVSNIYNRFPVDPSKVRNLTFSMYAHEISNIADLQVRLGTGGSGFGFDANALFSFSEKSTQKTIFVDITKTLFTIDAEHPSGGLFTDPDTDARDIIYIGSVTYGIRILASIELNVTDAAVMSAFHAKYDGLLFGGYIDAATFARDIKNQATVKLFVVGGLGSTVSTAFNIAELQQKLEDMTRSVNYHTCSPIRYTFRNNNGDVVSYKSATDYFKYRNCEPPGEEMKPATVTVKISEISFARPNQEEDDVELYGSIWANAYTAGNKFLPPYQNQYDLFQRSQALHLNKEDLKNYEYGKSYGGTVVFNFAAGEVKDAVLYVYFNLTDYDSGSGDDPIVMPDLKKYPVKNPDGNIYQFYGLRINLNDVIKGENGMANNHTVNCVDYEGDYPFVIRLTVIKK